ncbi:hypothetical protein BC628DRAFT_817651 [Trametes gibbosa]|nr:hypothetical protein BC628DRAFT_817651 [Trametes gibbosa]
MLSSENKGLRTCGRRQCKRLIPSEADYRWRTCPSCRVEARNRTRIRRAVPVDFPEDDDSDDEEDIPLAEVISARRLAQHAIQTDELLPIVPTYQHFAVLLTTLRARFREFAIAQAHYLRFKAQQRDAHVNRSGPHRSPHVFRFDGEYSVVADLSGGLVYTVVACVLWDVQAAVGSGFTYAFLR